MVLRVIKIDVRRPAGPTILPAFGHSESRAQIPIFRQFDRAVNPLVSLNHDVCISST